MNIRRFPEYSASSGIYRRASVFRHSQSETAALSRVSTLIKTAKQKPNQSLGQVSISNLTLNHRISDHLGRHLVVEMSFRLADPDDHHFASLSLLECWDEKTLRANKSACFVTRRTGFPRVMDVYLTALIPPEKYYFTVLQNLLGKFN